MPISFQGLETMVKRGIERGSARCLSKSMRHWELNYAPKCNSPVTLELHARPERDRPSDRDFVDRRKFAMWVTMLTKCRQCENCLKQRAAEWRLRSRLEVEQSSRTWLGTLTINPSWRFTILSHARAACGKDGVDFDCLEENQRYKALDAVISRHIRLYIVRLRKYSGSPLRFLCVGEAHKSGDPHYHLLVHEQQPDRPILKKVLQAEWKLGFSNFKLIDDPSGATYITKYLTKDVRARVRASILYGKRQV